MERLSRKGEARSRSVQVKKEGPIKVSEKTRPVTMMRRQSTRETGSRDRKREKGRQNGERLGSLQKELGINIDEWGGGLRAVECVHLCVCETERPSVPVRPG